MEYLPVVLGRKRPFLEEICSASGESRSVCPRGRLLALVKSGGALAVYSLVGESIESVISFEPYTSVQWVCPSQTPSECVVDDTDHSAHGELVGVGRGGDVTWWRVREGGGGVSVDDVVVFKRAELITELQRFGYAIDVSSMLCVGSSDGHVWLLVNSTLLCSVSLDLEFSRLTVVTCMSVEPNLQGVSDDVLPSHVGRVVDITFCHPLLLQLCHDGTVFIHHVELKVCVGVVNPIHYCHYTTSSSSQSDAEELLAQISTTQFTNLAVTSDLSQLAVTTHMNHVLLVNLPEYFEMFPGHYHHQFLSSVPHHNQRPTSRKKRRHDPHSRVSTEEEEERAHYRGTSSESRSRGDRTRFPRNYSWEQRWKFISQRVVSFEPGGLSFAGTSSPPAASVETRENRDEGKRRSFRVGGRGEESGHHESKCESGSEKAWYDEPRVMSDTPFELPYISNLHKTASTSLHSSSTDESRSHSTEQVSGECGMGSQQKHCYSTPSILPPADPSVHPGKRWRVVCVSVAVGRVVVYCGECDEGSGEEEEEEEGGELGCLVIISCPVKSVVVYDTNAMNYSVTKCHRATWLLPPSCPSHPTPHYLLSSHTLALAAFSLSQEEFVSKLLMYGSAVVAEEVCHVNRWDHCSLPINTLETALSLRQLDTVSFFLRSRDNENGSQELTETSAVDIPSLPPIPVEQLDTAIGMLLAAIRINHSQQHTSPFASRLLIMTLAFLTRLIKGQALFEEREGEGEGETQTGEKVAGSLSGENISGGGSRYRTVSGASVESVPHTTTRPAVSLSSLTGHVQQLRAYLPNSTVIRGATQEAEGEEEEVGEGADLPPATSPPDSPPLDQTLTKSWNKMGTKEVVKDALLRGCLPLAQAYLLHRSIISRRKQVSSLSLSDRSQSSATSTVEEATLSAVLATGCGFVLEALEKRSLDLATSLLTQMCMDVRSSLRHICFYTINRALRDFLAGELKVRGWLAEKESQALDYLHILESYYPLQSYEEAHALHSQQQTRRMAYQSTSLPFVPGIVTKTTSIPPLGDLHQLYPETFGGTHPVSHTDSSSPVPSPPLSKGCPPLYLQVPLSVVLDWDTATRQQLLYEAFVLRSQTDGSECEQLVDKEQAFDYMLRHNDSENALRFIMSRVPPLGNPAHCPSQIASLCSNIPQCVSHLRQSILDDLARQGILLSTELQSLSLLLTRLGRTHSLFSHPHPLSKSQDHTSSDLPSPGYSDNDGESIGGETAAVMSLEDFHSSFLHYCIGNGFASLMYHYLDCYNLALDEASISALHLDSVDQPWVDAMLKFRLLALNSADPGAVFQASLACGRLLLGVSSGGGSGGGGVMEMLQCGRTLMAIATLMYAPAPLEEVLSPSSSEQLWHVDSSILRSSVAAYPTLQAALFPSHSTSLTASQSQDITVYQLLQGTVPFNVSRLFKWQTTNTLATGEDTTEGPHEMPHFSHPALTERHAHVEHLTYIHYLCRGQPSFAFANFMAAKLLGRSHISKRVDRAVSRVYRLAMHDFTNSRLVSSCAAFIEMLDRDSRLLRIDVQAAVRIAQYSTESPAETNKQFHQSGEMNETHKNAKIASQFIQLHGSSEGQSLALCLLKQLETATHSLISSCSLDRCCLEAEEYWSLVQAFCGCHSLPPSTTFLWVCAQEAQWLPLLCHAQLYAILPQKVLPIIEKHFSSPHVQEHLRLALSSMDPTGPTALAASQRGGGSRLSQRSKSRRRRANTRIRLQQELQQQTLVRTQPDIRAKLYSKIGLQRERSPQPNTIKQDKPPSEQPLSPGNHTGRVSPVEECPPALSRDSLPSDLFSILFKCQSHSCPWRALLAHAIALQRPLLAILAACNKDAVMVDCMCVWLYSTLGYEQLNNATVLLRLISGPEEGSGGSEAQFSAGLQWHQWRAQDLALLLAVSLQLPASDTATHFTLAFNYFDHNNPLLSFFKFYEQFTLYCNLDQCKKHLLEFDLAMSKCSSVMGDYLGEIGDVGWVERMANMVTSHMLVICPTPFERSHLLRLLNDATFGHDFQYTGLDFKNLYEMSEVLSQAGLPSDAAFTIREHFNITPGAKSLAEVYSVRVRVDSDRVLGMLLEKAQFSIARTYAGIVGSTACEVTVKEAEHNLRKLSESSYWQYEQARLNFWHSCNTAFTAEKVDAELAAEFFESVVHHSSDPSTPTPTPSSPSPSSSLSSSPHSFPPLCCSASERALLLAFALKWRRETDTMTGDQMKEFEREIWRSHIHASVEDMQRAPGDKMGGSPLPFLPSCSPEDILSSEDPSSLLSTLSISVSSTFTGQRNLAALVLPDNVPVLTEAGHSRESTSSLTDSDEVKAFNMMLGRLLNACYISQARELAALFEHDSPDLTIVLCCIQLAQGKLSTDQLTDEVISLVSTHSPRHLSDLSLGFEQRGDSRPSVEIIRMMQKLSDRAKHAQQCCSCIITCFKIAVCLHLSYTSVVTSDSFTILRQVLGSRFTDRYQLAKKFVTDCNLKSKEVAGFLAECVASELQSQIGISIRDHDEPPRGRVYYAQMTSVQFVELAQLCPDQNEVGLHLLSMAKSLAASQPPTTENISVQVELLVRAHDCYTLGCSVDGISEVLLVVRQWVPNLVSLKLFSFMVRLLTGIGRFYEMAYILQLLMENDQFESLLHTGVEKEEQLRVALMDYLLTHHPNDHEKMQMVALKFGMFYELAKTKQEQAKRDLKKIKPKHLASSNPETVKTLKNAFETLMTAAKTYSQEDYLSSAQQCYSLARLVALQLSLLHESPLKQVINLDNKRVVKLMEELPFQEALIVADAYKRTSWTDWISPLYKKVVIGGHFRYLGDYKTAFPLKANMFQELASKYQHDRERLPESATNMKRLLTHLRNLPLKRKIATDLGLSDVLKSLSPTQDEGFLNDIARL